MNSGSFIFGKELGSRFKGSRICLEAAEHFGTCELHDKPGERPLKALRGAITRAPLTGALEILKARAAEEPASKKMHPPADPLRRLIRVKSLLQAASFSIKIDRERDGAADDAIGLDADGEGVPFGITREVDKDLPDERAGCLDLDLGGDRPSLNGHCVYSFSTRRREPSRLRPMSVVDRKAELSLALAAVREAARATTRVQDTLISEETLEKKDKSPVTIGDFAAQAIVGAHLAERSAIRAMIGEESANDLRENSDLRGRVVELVRAIRPDLDEEGVLNAIDFGGADPSTTGGTHYTLDPIDGTKGFLRREQYAIALGLIVGGKVELAVLGCPRLENADGSIGGLYYALRGEGAYFLPLAGEALEGERISVDGVSDPSKARFCESVEAGHSDQDWSVQVARSLGIESEAVRMDSQAKYASLARGDASIYLRLPTRKGYEEKIWDHAAGALIVEEAGGKVTDIDGKPLDFSRGATLKENRGVIASSGAFHDAIVRAVKEFEPSS